MNGIRTRSAIFCGVVDLVGILSCSSLRKMKWDAADLAREVGKTPGYEYRRHDYITCGLYSRVRHPSMDLVSASSYWWEVDKRIISEIIIAARRAAWCSEGYVERHFRDRPYVYYACFDQCPLHPPVRFLNMQVPMSCELEPDPPPLRAQCNYWTAPYASVREIFKGHAQCRGRFLGLKGL